jgi:outer membrane immunogenic protein
VSGSHATLSYHRGTLRNALDSWRWTRKPSHASAAALAWLAMSMTANAADMPVPPPAKAPVYAPAFNWTGFYVGVNGGIGVANRTVTFSGNDTVTRNITCEKIIPSFQLDGETCPSPIKSNPFGGVVGVQAGYNWQFRRNWVIGLEAEFDASNVRGNGTSRFLYPIFDPARNVSFAQPANLHSSEELKWFGTVKGRLGFVPTERSLLFVTGGLAYGQVNQTMTVNLPDGNANLFGGDKFGYGCGPTGANCFVGTNSKFAVGWTLGGGLEIALTNSITVKSEYSYLNLGDGGGTKVQAQSLIGGIGFAPASFTATSSRLDYHVVRLGLSVKDSIFAPIQ